MPTEVIVPSVGESITEVEIGQWLVKEGQPVKKDDPIVEIATDKTNLELPAPADGVVATIKAKQGTPVSVGDVIALFEEGAAGKAAEGSGAKGPSEDKSKAEPQKTNDSKPSAPAPIVMPAAQKLLDENKLKPEQVKATGPGGRLLKEDVLNHLKSNGDTKASPKNDAKPALPVPNLAPEPGEREEQVVPMTPLRRKIAANLVQAQHTAALLTTFNEVDMTNVMALRAQHQDAFTKRHGIKLGFMSFFVKAVIDGLKQFPAVNAEVRENSIAYKNYYDIGIAIGGGKGLVVPVVRNADRLSFAEIEQTIANYAVLAKDGKIKPEDLMNGTFTITNGGVYGSLLSTPIVNPPQSGVLGMHGIVRRPIAVGEPGKDERIEIRPMMYIALTYDHRVIDGREAVTFLKRVKESVEDPARLLLEA
jgi:2-oxoglutarate dehydrogenase E2 component (dihydrolipoamide succinyltransferase)